MTLRITSAVLAVITLFPCGLMANVTLGISDSDGLLDDTSTIAAPGQSFTVAIALGISAGETVGGITFLPKADKSGVLKMTGRSILSSTLSDPTADLASDPNLSPQSSIDVGVTTQSVNIGVTQNETLMQLTLTVDPATPLSAYPIQLSFGKARWATTGANSVSAPIDTAGAVYYIFAPGGTPPTIQAAASRKNHPGAGAFDIPLTVNAVAGTPAAVECRSGGPTQLIITYDMNIGGTATVGLSVGTLGVVSAAANQLTVNLSGVPDATCLTITIDGITPAGSPGVVGPAHVIRLAALLGDVNGNRTVNVADIGLVKSRSGLPIDANSFRMDLNVNGQVNVADIGLVKSKSGTSISCSY